MAHTPLFSKLRSTLAKALFARKARARGLTDPAEIDREWSLLRERRPRPSQRPPAPLQRRDFLKWSAGALAVSALPAVATGCPSETDGPTGEAKVAIVGGGMAGLHCAYRLHAAGVDVTVYEASKRTGGRMYTGRDLYPEGLICELGGELVDTQHATMWSLSEELDIRLDDRWADEPAGLERDVYYIGGVEVSEQIIVDQFTPVAEAMATQVAAADSDDAAFEQLDNTTLQDWLDENCPKDTSPELHEILRSAYRGEYGLECEEQSCLNLLYFIDYENPEEFAIFGPSDERYHTHTGNDTFPTKLAAGLPEQILTEHRLVSAKDAAGGQLTLTFEKADQSRVDVTVDHVVFALPFTLLREVDLADLTLTDLKRKLIDELGYGTNAKVMTAYSSRLWITDHDAGGSLVTDLPIQQTWDTTIGQSGTTGILTNFLGGQGGLDCNEGTPEEYHAKVLPDLEQVWPGMQGAYLADSAVRMHWPTHEFTKGSYGCYRPGQWSFYGHEGEREGNVHFCGEHTSLDFQGFMEGAAESGALVAGAILEDLGVQPTAAHAAILDAKLSLPQPFYRGQTPPRLRLTTRRRQRLQALEAQFGPINASRLPGKTPT